MRLAESLGFVQIFDNFAAYSTQTLTAVAPQDFVAFAVIVSPYESDAAGFIRGLASANPCSAALQPS